MAESRIEELRRRVGSDPGSRLFAQLAEEERKAGDLKEAIRVARAEGVRAAPQEAVREADDILGSRSLGQALEALGKLQEAVGRYRASLKTAPGEREITNRSLVPEEKLAGVGAPAGEAVPAMAGQGSEANGAEALPFSSPTLAELYLRQGFGERALEVYRQVVAENPSDERAQQRLAELASEMAADGRDQAYDAAQRKRQALQRAITGLELLLGMARRR